MAIPTLDGWTTGEKVTAAKLTKHTKTAIESSVYYKPVCQITNLADQSFVSDLNGHPVTLSNVVYDTDGMADTANNQIAIKTAGLYRVTIGHRYRSNANGSRYTILNGPMFMLVSGRGNDIGAHGQTATRTGRYRIGDLLSLTTIQNSGVTLSTDGGGGGGMYIEVEWIAL